MVTYRYLLHIFFVSEAIPVLLMWSGLVRLGMTDKLGQALVGVRLESSISNRNPVTFTRPQKCYQIKRRNIPYWINRTEPSGVKAVYMQQQYHVVQIRIC